MTHSNPVSTKQVRSPPSRGLRPGPPPTSQGPSQLSLPGPQVGHQEMTGRVPALVRRFQGYRVSSVHRRGVNTRIRSEGSLWDVQ